LAGIEPAFPLRVGPARADEVEKVVPEPE